MTAATLALDSLTVAYRRRGAWVDAVRDASLLIRPGESLGLVGESGSGKTTLALAAMGYLPSNARLVGGTVHLSGRDVRALGDRGLRRRWRDSVGLVPQDPRAALNPTMTIADQMAELLPTGIRRDRRRATIVAQLAQVRLADPARVAERYPHQLSGGMVQRVMIAMAICRAPALLVLDEPTTALDVTTEAVMLDLIRDLVRGRDTAVLYVTHNLGVVANTCDRVAVMRAGEIVESGATEEVFRHPRHAYTRALLESVPRLGRPIRDRSPRHIGPPASIRSSEFGQRATRALDVARLSKRFPIRRSLAEWLARRPERAVQAVADLDLSIAAGHTLGVVGESGSGKTTLALCITGLVEPSGGTVEVDDEACPARLEARSHTQIRRLQMVLQHPDDALNPYRTVGETLERTLRRLGAVPAATSGAAVVRLLDQVRLPAEFAGRRPAQLSGGERQRAAIARAFASRPDVLLLDEPVSALDVSVQAAILRLLRGHQHEHGTAFLLISHDLAAVSALADRIAVMYLGQVMEIGPAAAVLGPPHHPYTEALLAAVPTVDGGTHRADIRLSAEVPSAIDRPSGCPFHTRCPRFIGRVCVETVPPWQTGPDGRRIFCHIPLDELRALQRPDGVAPTQAD